MLSFRSLARVGVLVLTLGAATAGPLACQAGTKATEGGAGADAARSAYFSGDVAGALRLAQSAGERWIGGLAAFRLKQYAGAEVAFDRLAHDAKAPDGVRAASAWWASRAAASAGHEAIAAADLRLAAAAPHTFYGMIAERKLKLDAGRSDETAASARAATSRFPTPTLTPDGGFTVEKALVYALVRQESRFRSNAIGGGAVGLMQLTPATAARLGGSRGSLTDPGANLRLGQAYISKLLGSAKGDVLRALAAWNTGAAGKPAADGDSLLAMESTPGASTRSFVQSVMVAYWSYQRIFGADTASLDAATRGAPMAIAALN